MAQVQAVRRGSGSEEPRGGLLVGARTAALAVFVRAKLYRLKDRRKNGSTTSASSRSWATPNHNGLVSLIYGGVAGTWTPSTRHRWG